MKQTLCALAVLASVSAPVLAESVDVRVIGTITPTACVPTLSGGGTVDYGAINPNTLSATQLTLLAEKQLDISITCDAPAKVALKAKSQRPGTVAGAVTETAEGVGSVSIPGRISNLSAGLGLDGNAKIGGYSLTLSQLTADNQAVDVIAKGGVNGGWTPAYNTLFFTAASPYIVSWGATGTQTPVAFKNMSGKLSVQAYINKTSELDVTRPVALNGLSTIELVYL